MRATGVVVLGAVLLMTLACGGSPSSPGEPSELPSIGPSETLPPITIEPPTGTDMPPGATPNPGSPSAAAGSATVDGLPGQREAWSGAASCDEQVGGPVVWITVPSEANEHWVEFDLYVLTPPNTRVVVGGRPASITEVSGDPGTGRLVANVDDLDQCRRTRDGETPEPGAPDGYVCPYRDETATITVTWSCPGR